jgi:16S rRNA (cytosine1402-N4)-methyltransferase
MNGHPVPGQPRTDRTRLTGRLANLSSPESDLKPFIKARRGIVGANLNALFTLISAGTMTAETIFRQAPHLPVMLPEVLNSLSPRDGGIYVDGTFGAGGYSRAILESAHCNVVAIDRDPDAIRNGHVLAEEFSGRLTLVEGRFGDMKALLANGGITSVDGVVLDIGVSSMQIDEAERGFSFMRDGPLDMRMAKAGPTAADAVNTLAQEQLSRIIYIFGEEPRSRAIAKAIVGARAEAPITTTAELVRAVEKAIGRQRPQDRIHPATRTFQALRIHVNGELDELVAGLHAAERMLAPGGCLVVVTFHSLEDRIVKRFFTSRAGKLPAASRHLPETVKAPEPSFELPFKGHLGASDAEAVRNPRARSAKLRAGIRTAAPAMPSIADAIGVSLSGGSRH